MKTQNLFNAKTTAKMVGVKNAGQSIMALSSFIWWLNLVGIIFTAFILINMTEMDGLWIFSICVGAFWTSCVEYILIYGFGALINNSFIICEKLRIKNFNDNAPIDSISENEIAKTGEVAKEENKIEKVELYTKVEGIADTKIKSETQDINKTEKEQAENANTAKQDTYKKACEKVKQFMAESDISALKTAISSYEQIKDYKDSAELAKKYKSLLELVLKEKKRDKTIARIFIAVAIVCAIIAVIALAIL